MSVTRMFFLFIIMSQLDFFSHQLETQVVGRLGTIHPEEEIVRNVIVFPQVSLI